MEENTEMNITEQIENLKTALYDIRYGKLKGHMIRAKAQYINQGEKPKNIDGTTLTEQSEIRKETEICCCIYMKIKMEK